MEIRNQDNILRRELTIYDGDFNGLKIKKPFNFRWIGMLHFD